MDIVHTHGQPTPSFWRSRYGIGWLVLVGVAAWFLWTEHRAHLFGALPWLVLLACPLMHVFMHRGHHGHHGHGGTPTPAERPAATPGPGDNTGAAP